MPTVSITMIFVPFFFASLLWSWVVAFPTMSDVQADSTSMVENSTNTFHYEAIQTMQNRWQKFWADSKHFNNRYTHTFDNGSSLTVPREELFRILNPDNITTVIVNNTVTTLWADGTPLIDENDPCHMRSYELYKEYTNKECTPPNQFAPNGVDCNVHNGTLTHCIDFCQVRKSNTQWHSSM